MKRFLYAFALTVFVFLSSCSQEAGTATMRILLYQEEQKTISVSESAFDITKYTVTGTGPGGSSFTADTTSTSLVMEGLQTGSWTLKATGFNSRGKAVAGGEVTSQFESDSSNISLPVSRIKGTGKLVVSFSWDEAVSEPVITVSLRKAGSVQAEETEYSFEGSSGTVRITGLDSGFYVFKVSLSSRGSRITGLCEAVQISGDETTEASISFCSKADYPKALGELYISRSGESPVRGHLSRSGNTVVSGSTQSVRLELTGSDLPDLSLTWFMDGEEIEGQNGGTLEFLPCSGWHIINAVIVSPSLGLSGSVGWKFEALSNAAQGTAVYNGEVSSFVSDPSSLIGAVGDDRFIVLCPSQGLLQVLKVYNNTLITESVVRETDEGFSWLSLSDGLYSSALMNEFAITDSGKNINLLYLDDGVIRQCTLQAENIRYEGYALGEKFSPLEYAWADGTNSVIGFSCFENAILVLKFENGAVIHQSRCLKPRNNNDLLFVMSGGNLGLCANTAGEFFSCGFTENRFSGTWKKSGVEAFYTTPVTIAASRYIAETSSGSLCLWVPGTNRWQHRGTSDISPVCLSAGTGVGYLYAMTAEGKLTTFSLSDSGMRKINILDTSMKVNSLIAGSRSLLGVRSDGSLVLFSIAGGDK